MTIMLTKGRELYAALNSGDVAALHRLMTPDFTGKMSAGLPGGLGREFSGLDEMLSGAWATVEQLLELELTLERLIESRDQLVAKGTYVGTARSTGRQLRASFAYFWSFDGDRFVGMTQITDTALWRDALDA